MTIFLAVLLIAAGFALGRRSARHGASTPPADPYRAAARAYCRARFNYGDIASASNGWGDHIERDARAHVDEPWLRAVVDAALGREGDHA